MQNKIKLEYRLIHEDAIPPSRNLDTDAAFDLYSIESHKVMPRDYGYFRIGIQVAAPPGYYWTTESRSGMVKKGIFALRTIIDAAYTGEVIVYLFNMGHEPFMIRKGDRIAQMILHKVVQPRFMEVSEFSEEYNQRGEAGWGSSGA